MMRYSLILSCALVLGGGCDKYLYDEPKRPASSSNGKEEIVKTSPPESDDDPVDIPEDQAAFFNPVGGLTYPSGGFLPGGGGGHGRGQGPSCSANVELCDGQDNNCNGQIDETCTQFFCTLASTNLFSAQALATVSCDGNDANGSSCITETGRVGTCQGGKCEEHCADVQCGELCTDLNKDANNCGACGKKCHSSQECVSGLCQCDSGKNLCNGVCVDTERDTENCGACGASCNFTGDGCCVAGACVTNAEHCLAAGSHPYQPTQGDENRVCQDNTDCVVDGRQGICQNGICTADCPYEQCDDECIDTATDQDNCGRCGLRCGAEQRCSNGLCSCEAGQNLCGGACKDIGSDFMNCGGCGLACDEGTHACCVSGTCVQDRNSCPESVCPAGFARCHGACVNMLSSNEHCGLCNNACAHPASCLNGACDRAGREQPSKS